MRGWIQAVCACAPELRTLYTPHVALLRLVAAAAAIAKATAAMEEPANAAFVRAAVAMGNRGSHGPHGPRVNATGPLEHAVPAAARMISDTLVEYGFSAGHPSDPTGDHTTVFTTVLP